VSLPRTLRLSALVGLLVLLVAGCGGHAAVTGTNSSSPSIGISATTPIVGTGPPSGQVSGNDGGGGISISLPGVPIGQGPNRFNYGNYECIQISPIGQQVPHGDIVIVTTATVVGGPFTAVDLPVTNCPEGPACQNFRFSAATGDGASCYTGVEFVGAPPSEPNTSISGSLELGGELSCPNVNVATCHQDGINIQNSGDTSIEFDAEPTSSSTGTSSTPSTGTSSTPSTGTSSS
jgi:hypothetical protein